MNNPVDSLNFSGLEGAANLCGDWSFWKGEGRCSNENKSNWKQRFPAILCNTEIDCNLTAFEFCCTGSGDRFWRGCLDFEELKYFDELEDAPSAPKFANYHFCNRSKIYVLKGKH